MIIKNYLNNLKTSMLLSFLMISMLVQSATAQTTPSVKGVVKDDLGVLAGVSVIAENKSANFKQVSVANENGVFTFAKLPAGEGYSFTFSFVGYETQTLSGYTIKDGSTVSLAVTMKESVTSLNQVVVIGYGTQKKEKTVTAISSVGQDFINKQQVPRIEQALQGSTPGVMVLGATGQPGEKPMIRIRGTGTNQNPDPLYVVDGFPVESIEYLNPGDIDRIDILKDAASSAIYGSRGANGVVLVTTKTGKKGETSITYDGYYGIQNNWRSVPVLNATQYAEMMNEGALNAKQPIKYADPSAFGNGTNWQDAVFNKNAPVTNHQLSVTGGTDKANYITSFSYFSQQGIVGGDKSKFDRYTLRFNGDQKVKDFLKIGANINYTFSENKGISSNAAYGGVLNNAINLDPITPVYETDPVKLAGYPAAAVVGKNGIYGISNILLDGPTNPLAGIEIANAYNKTDKLLSNAYAELNIWKGLKFKSSFGIDLSNYSNKNYSPVYFMNSASKRDISSVAQSYYRNYTWQIENVLSYSETFGKHTFGAVLGQSALKQTVENMGGSRLNLLTNDPDMSYIDLAADINSAKVNGGAYNRALASYFGRINYDYDGKYLLSGSIRRDGSSRFGRNNPYATFPSVSGGWVISRESFFNVKAINSLKLRASWGQNGNENIGTNVYPWAAGVQFGNGYTFVNSSGAEYYYNGAALGPIPNPDLRWETSEQTDIGMDIEFLNGKFSFSADYYVKNTKDLLFNPSIPAIVGFTAPYVNGGSVSNKGVELGLGYRSSITSDWKISANLNVSYNKNEVTAINTASQSVAGSGFIGVGSVNRMEVGMPIGYFWGFKTVGLFQNQAEVDAYVNADGKKLLPNAVPGDIRFLDLNGDGAINDKDKTMIGNPNPDFTTGLNITTNYKQFDLSVFVIGMFGQDLINGIYRYDIREANMPSSYLDRWTGEGSTAKYPRFTFDDKNGNRNRMSDIYVEKGDFIRFKNVQLGYTLPNRLANKAKFSNVRVYLAADNLFTITNYSGFDPEIGATNPLSIGIDQGVYPQARTFRLGISAKL
ncbi:SusC/RagA family TonB-linked outer membrane protein [Solitalea canadensis]|nr:TonB-dependent receptor [Solitalea canadensis]